MDEVKNVCILGGTHGNELSGVFLLKKWKEQAGFLKRPTFTANTVLANPEATKLVRRFKDCDLNRSFTKENLESEITDKTPYEVRRAKEIRALLGPNGQLGLCEVILDLHNTTSNMKVCFMHCSEEPFMLQMFHYAESHLPKKMCYMLFFKGAMNLENDTTYLYKYGIGIEVGPQPHGVLRSDIFQLQEDGVRHCLDFIEAYNSGIEFPEVSLITHEVKCVVNYPRDENGEISAAVHPSLQDKDWNPLKLDDPVFILFNGNILKLRDVVQLDIGDDEAVYPCFINEAAYYEEDVAFYITKKVCLNVPSVKKS